MKSEDRKRATQRESMPSERASRASGARTRDSGATNSSNTVTRGKGRRDEAGRSAVYPASAASEPSDDADVVLPGQLGREHEHAG